MDLAALKKRMEEARRFEVTVGEVVYVCVVPTGFDNLAAFTRHHESEVEKVLALILRVLRDWRGVSIDGEALPCVPAAIRLWFVEAEHSADLMMIFNEASRRAAERRDALEADRKN